MKPLSRPNPGQVHVWSLSLPTDIQELVRLEKFLSPEERLRGSRLCDLRIRYRFVAARGLLREILARYQGRKAETLQLIMNEHGKPRLAENEGSQVLNFSVSHTGDVALLALSASCEIGVDIEQVRNDLPFPGMAQRYFSLRERQELFSLPHDAQLEAFYHCWTRKEAYMKGCGAGFTLPSDSFDVSLLPGHPPALIAHRLSPGEPARWSLMDLDIETGYCAALAADRTITAIQYFSPPSTTSPAWPPSSSSPLAPARKQLWPHEHDTL